VTGGLMYLLVTGELVTGDWWVGELGTGNLHRQYQSNQELT